MSPTRASRFGPAGPLRFLAPALVAVVTVLVAVVTVLVLPSSPSSANTENNQFATVKIEALDLVPWEPGLPLAAQVSVSAERAVSGTLTVTSDSDGSASTTYEFDIDLAGGSTAAVPVDLFTGWNGVNSSATLTSNGQVVAADEFRAFGQGNGREDRIAVLGIDSPPQRVALIGGEQQLRIFELDSNLRGLERATSLVTTAGAMTGLGGDSEQMLRIKAWVQGGGQLVVDGPPASLDSSFNRYPTANENRFQYGAGSVVYMDDWEDGIPLGGYLGTSGLRELVDNQDLGSGASGELAILAGISLPSARTVGIILLAYSLIAGPIAFALLSARGSQRRMWAVLPALSLVFVVGILGFGFASRTGRSDTHITIVEVNEQASRATSNLLLTSSTGGGRGFEVPSTWAYLGQGRIQSQRPVKIRAGNSSTEISLETPPGGSSTARVVGVATQFDGALAIENISFSDNEVSADIVNRSEADLTNVVAMLGNARTPVGDLAAGDSASFSIEARDSSGRTMRELLSWPRVRREWNNNGNVAVPVDREAVTAAGAWTEWRTEQGSSAMPETTLGVVGWTDDLAGPVAGVTEGRTALFVRQNLPDDVRSAIGFTTVAKMATRNAEPEFDGNFQGYPEDYRVTLSEGYDLDRLAIQVDRNSSAVGFLTADGWRYADLPDRGEATLAIPSEAVLDGEVTIRSLTPPWSWGTGLTLAMTEDPDGERVALVGEPQYRNTEGDFGFDERFDGPGAGPGELRQLEEGAVTEVDLADAADGPLQFDGLTENRTYDAYRFALEDGDSIVVTMSSGRGDSYLELVGTDDELVAFNDDYGQNVNSQIRFTAVDAGDYEIRAQDLGSGSVSYELQIEVEQ